MISRDSEMKPKDQFKRKLQQAIIRSQVKVGTLNENRRHIQQGNRKFFSRHVMSRDRPQTELNAHQNLISIDSVANPGLLSTELQKEVAASGVNYRNYP